MALKSLLSFIGFLSIAAQAQVSPHEINFLIKGSLKTLIKTQHQEDDIPQHWKGEWESTKQNIRPIIFLGAKGKAALDSNCFTTGHIHNELSDYLLRNPNITEAESLSKTLNLAFDNLITFQNKEGHFGFWHRLPLTEKMKSFAQTENKDIEIFRPNQYELTNNFTLKRANVPADADDTSLVYSAYEMQMQLNKKFPRLFTAKNLTIDLEVFNQFRDIKRKNVHPLNKLHGNFNDTNAYMTWFAPDASTFVGGLTQKFQEAPQIPFGVNDIDCVVNANVLQSLARYNQTENNPAAKASCQYIEKAIDKGLSKKCGFYYPSPYYLHFVVARALEAGVSCLKDSALKLNQELVKEQNSHGYWGWEKEPKSNDRKKYLYEPVSSTIYALNAMIIYADKLHQKNVLADRVQAATNFVVKSAVVDAKDQSVKWTEGVSSLEEALFAVFYYGRLKLIRRH